MAEETPEELQRKPQQATPDPHLGDPVEVFLPFPSL